MTDQIISGVIPALVQAFILILTAAITAVSGVVITYLQKKKTEVIQKIGADKYNNERQIAIDIFYFVEQHFKGLKNVADKKRELFEAEILKKLPYLKPEDLSRLRETAVGAFNAQLKQSGISDPVITQ